MKLKRLLSLLLCAAMLVGMVCTTAFAEDTLEQISVSSAEELTEALKKEGDYEITVTADLSYTASTSVQVARGTKVINGQSYTDDGYLTLTCSTADTYLTVKDFTVRAVTVSGTGNTLTLSGSTAVTYRVNLSKTDNSTTLTVKDSATVETIYTGYGTINIQDNAKVSTISNIRYIGNISDNATVGTISAMSGTAYVSGNVTLNSVSKSLKVSGELGENASIHRNITGFTGTAVTVAEGTDSYTLQPSDVAAFSVTESNNYGGCGLQLDEENNQIVYGPDGSGWTIDLSVNNETLEANDDGTYTITATKDNYNTEYTTADSVKAVSALVEPDVIVTDNEENILTEGTDYTVSYATTATSSSTGLNTAQVTVTNLTDSSAYTITYYIQQMNASDSGVTVGDVEMEFVGVSTNSTSSISAGYELFMDMLEVCDANGNKLTGLSKFYRDEESGSITVVEDYLSANYDYTVSVNLTEVGSTKFTVTFQGVYYGTMTGTLTLTARDLSNAEVTIDDAYWTGEAVEPTPYVTYTDILGDENILTEGTDYTVSYENNINFGTATVTISAVDGSNYTGETTTTFSIVEAWDGELPVENQLELREALEAGYEEITVGADFALSSPVEITYDVTLKSVDGESYAITSRGMSKTDSMFVVSDGASLTLEDITIDGNDQTGLLYISSGGSATVGDGTTLTGGYKTNGYYGAALYIEEGAEVTVSGTIRDTYGLYAIYNHGTLNIQDGAYLTHLGESTSGYAALLNTSTGILNWSGGSFDADMDEGYYQNQLSGSLIRNIGEFNLSGGTINGFLLERDDNGDPVLDVDGNYTYSDSERTSVYFGAVQNAKAGTFNMTGGSIQGFEAAGDASSNSYGPSGAGVYNAGTFNLSGGLIAENVCTGSTSSTASGQGNNYTSSSSGSGMGGGVYNAGVFTMTGGTISNNSAQLGGGVYNAGARNLTNSYSEDAGTFTMTGGTITGNSVFSETVYSASSTDNMMGSEKGTLVAGVGSALYVGGGSTTVLSGGTIDTDQINTVETTDSDGNTVEETVSVGIAVVPLLGTRGNASGASFNATVATDSSLPVAANGTDIQVGILLVDYTSATQTASLNNYSELTSESELEDYDITLNDDYAVDLELSAWLTLSEGLETSLDVTALSIFSSTVEITNMSNVGVQGITTSWSDVTNELNGNGVLVADYDENATASESDGEMLTLYANGGAVDEAEAAIYLTEESTWVICTHTQTVENEDGTTSEAETWDEGVVTAPTCTEDGYTTYTCTVCGAEKIVTDEGSATGHSYGEPEFVWSGNEDDGYSATATFTCTECDEDTDGHTYTVDCEIISAVRGDGNTVYTATCQFNGTEYTGDYMPHTHIYEGSVEKTEPTCTEDGTYVVTVACTVEGCDYVFYTYTVTIPATGHTWDEGTVTTPATCTTDGVRTYTCTACDVTKIETIAATGHTYSAPVFTWADDYSSATAAFTCSVCSDVLTTVCTVTSATTEATATKDGQTVYTASVTLNGTKYTDAQTVTIPATGATFLFDDVQNESASYYDAVYWAYNNGITTGTSATLFSPNGDCTRGQFVTFLWRLAGKPTPTTSASPYTDVTNTSASYYYAVLWAVENGITKGTSDTTFSPNDHVTRGQAVTFLCRYETNIVNGGVEPTVSTSNPFTDVTNTSASYYTPVLWAVANGITKGTSDTTFSPSVDCTRGQVVTFLYRYAGQ